MCGIVGIAGAREPVLAETLFAMRDRLAHRGPDDAGIAFSRDGRTAFGHRRLAILDPTPAGHQPMANRAGTLFVTHNGEIYNFRALAAELAGRGYAFSTRTDTEVLLAAFEHWGLECLEHLRGMYAFAIWNEETEECMLVRDRLGVKPLYYAQAGGTLYFASEATALLAAPALGRDLDPAGLGDYLAYGYVPRDRSIWRGVKKLPPAHHLVFRHGEATVRRYWAPPAGPRPDLAAGDPEALRAEIEESVRLILVADVPVGAFLSGGLDSSTIVAFMSTVANANGHNLLEPPEPIHSYTIDFDDQDHSETRYARLVAERYATDHKERRLTLSSAIDALREVVASYDEPLADQSIVPTYFISEAVAADVKVVVSGDGGDEIFAGYKWYGKLDRIERLRARLGPLAGPLAKLQALFPGARPGFERLAHRLRLLGGPALDNYFRLIGFFDGPRRTALLDPAVAAGMDDDALWLFRAHWRPDLPLVRRLQLLDLETYLADDILAKVDRASMRHSLETRVPFLDHRLVEHALSLPLKSMYRRGVGKRLLRQVARPLLPESLIARPKRGFGLPGARWQANGLGAFLADRLRSGELVKRGLVRPAAIERLLARPAGRNASRTWQLAVLDLWLEAHLG